MNFNRWIHAQEPLWVRVQAAWRGTHCRIKDRDVARIVLALYDNRTFEVKICAAVFIQRITRRFLARLRMSAWSEVQYQHNLDRKVALQRLQSTARVYVARKRKLLAMIEAERILALENKAAARIQAFVRGVFGKYNTAMKKQELERLKRIRNRKALICQRVFRGYMGREEAEGQRLQLKMEAAACTEVQRVFRGSRVLHWRDVRMNKVAAFVFRREELELDERAAAVEERDRLRIEGNQHDSASDEDIVAIEWAEAWQELWDDEQNCQYWFNASLNETSYDAPSTPFDAEMELVNRNIKVYWPMEMRWFQAYISAFNMTKKRHRVEYPDGDHEWIDLEEEKERIMIEDDHGAWLMYNLYCPPLMAARRQELARVTDKKRLHRERMANEKGWVDGGFDEDKEKRRWFNDHTGDIRFQAWDYDDWVEELDGDKCTQFRNLVTGEIRSLFDPDPRFDPPEDSPNVIAAKDQITKDMSMGLYLCSALMEEYYAAPEHPDKDRRKIMDKIIDGNGVRQLATALAAARKTYTDEDFLANDLFVAAEAVLKQVRELAKYGEWQREEIKKKRQALLSTDKPKKQLHCPKCSYEVKQSDKFCPTCGSKLTGVGLNY